MKNITKNLMSIGLGTALLAGSLGFSSTIEASPHNNMVYMDEGEQRPPEPDRYRQPPPPPPQDNHGPEQPPPPPQDNHGRPQPPPPPQDNGYPNN